jgi:FtsH-binding integral membrane protein
MHLLPLTPLQIPIAIMVLLDPAVNHDTIYGHTHLSTLMCLISSGYFLYDLLIVIARWEGGGMLVHAACCLFVYTYAVYSFYLHFFGELGNSNLTCGFAKLCFRLEGQPHAFILW